MAVDHRGVHIRHTLQAPQYISSSMSKAHTASPHAVLPVLCSQFYAPWCPHCKNHVSTIQSVAKALHGVAKVEGSMRAACLCVLREHVLATQRKPCNRRMRVAMSMACVCVCVCLGGRGQL